MQQKLELVETDKKTFQHTSGSLGDNRANACTDNWGLVFVSSLGSTPPRGVIMDCSAGGVTGPLSPPAPLTAPFTACARPEIMPGLVAS